MLQEIPLPFANPEVSVGSNHMNCVVQISSTPPRPWHEVAVLSFRLVHQSDVAFGVPSPPQVVQHHASLGN